VNALLIGVDSWIIALALGAAMLAAWGLGAWRGRRLARGQRDAPSSKFDDAILALLGLLLAFTFSMSLNKHDERRQGVVTDSNAIGDFSTCVSLLKEPYRAKLHGMLRAYVEKRMELSELLSHREAFERALDEIQEMQGRMQALVGQAVDAGTPVAIPLVNTFNEVTSSDATRLSAMRDRLPASIVAVLALAAVLVMFQVGTHHAARGEKHFGACLGFVALVCLVVWVTLDLNQPYRGLIIVSKEPYQRLLSGMGK
jgi:hypothetical protein